MNTEIKLYKTYALPYSDILQWKSWTVKEMISYTTITKGQGKPL